MAASTKSADSSAKPEWNKNKGKIRGYLEALKESKIRIQREHVIDGKECA